MRKMNYLPRVSVLQINCILSRIKKIFHVLTYINEIICKAETGAKVKLPESDLNTTDPTNYTKSFTSGQKS